MGQRTYVQTPKNRMQANINILSNLIFNRSVRPYHCHNAVDQENQHEAHSVERTLWRSEEVQKEPLVELDTNVQATRHDQRQQWRVNQNGSVQELRYHR